MLILLSPAKRIDVKSRGAFGAFTQPEMIGKAEALAKLLKAYSPSQLRSLMGISDQLAVMNASRYSDWERRHELHNARQAIFAYAGDVYRGLNAATLSEQQIGWAQSHIRILSGLYGLLRPLDLIQAHRLEMGTRLPNPKGNTLYAYWGDTITESINRELKNRESDVVVNLASEEYGRAVDAANLSAAMITPVFQEWRSGKWKVIPVHTKRARGLMARYAAIHELHDPVHLQAFDYEGYDFDHTASDETHWVFIRRGT